MTVSQNVDGHRNTFLTGFGLPQLYSSLSKFLTDLECQCLQDYYIISTAEGDNLAQLRVRWILSGRPEVAWPSDPECSWEGYMSLIS
jgi:hypothetical protein